MWLLEVKGEDRSTRLTKDGILVSVTCYTGKYCQQGDNYDENEDGLNNPKLSWKKDVGPLPEGLYTIEGPPYDDSEHGKYILRLNPYDSNEMFGRSGFLIHGKPLPPKNILAGSKGCMCADHDIRIKIYQSGDIVLQVQYIQ